MRPGPMLPTEPPNALPAPDIIVPRPVPLSGPDDGEPLGLSPQAVADALSVFGYAFAPTRAAQRECDPDCRWMYWPAASHESQFDTLWMGYGTRCFDTLQDAVAVCVEKVELYVLKERALEETGSFCAGATTGDIDALLAWIDGARQPPANAPSVLLRAWTEHWRLLPSAPPGYRTGPMTMGEWRTGLHAARSRSHANPEPSNDIRVHALRVVEQELRIRLERLPCATRPQRVSRL